MLQPILLLAKVQAFILLLVSAVGRTLSKLTSFGGDGGFLTNDDDDDDTNDNEPPFVPPSVEQVTNIIYWIYIVLLVYFLVKFILDQIIVIQQLIITSLQSDYTRLHHSLNFPTLPATRSTGRFKLI